MTEQDKPQFGQLLDDTFAAYSKELPSVPAIMDAWWKLLVPFPFQVVVKAMQVYAEEETKFPPVPVAIAKLCKLMDGRPGVEEALAIALTARDEADTVVWTPEIAEAFNLARPMIDKDELISARMMFKEAYTKLVANARLNYQPVKWVASMGTDAAQRESVLLEAVTKGLLPAPHVAGLLPYHAAEENDSDARAGLEKVKALMLTFETKRIVEEELTERRKENDRRAVNERRQELQEQHDRAKK
jgi:hypothetical protein